MASPHRMRVWGANVHSHHDDRPGPRGPWALLGATAICVAFAFAANAAPSYSQPLDDFFEQSASATVGDLDLRAPRVPLLDLPLVARAIDRIEAGRDTVITNAYPALARWHFWMGEHFDRRHRGLWGVDPFWLAKAGRAPSAASAELNGLQLVQLESLANMAARRGLVYDALVWWTERRQLRSRLSRELYDPETGAYADRDSNLVLHAASPLASMATLVLGAAHVPTRSLAQLRRALDDPDSVVADGRFCEASLAFAGPQRGYAVARQCASLLFDRDLERRLRESLALRGIEAPRNLEVAAELGGVEVDLGELLPTAESAVEEARAALSFLRRGGFVPAESHPALEAHLDSLASAALPLDDESVDRLTDALVDWRGQDLAHQKSSWISRRSSQPDVDPPPSQFHFSDSDAPHWIGRALDLLAEVVVGHALRTNPSSAARLRFADDLRGSGDSAVLLLSLPPDARTTAPSTSTLLWTDGIAVLSPLELQWVPTESDYRADVVRVPEEPGLWRAIVTGIRGGVRSAPSLAVVEALETDVVARTPRRDGHPHRVRLHSRVDYPLRGAIEVDAPLSWRVSPASRITYALGPRETRILELTLQPDADVSPGSYPVRWHFYDGRRELRASSTEAVRPFRWVGIGPFASPSGDVSLPRGLLPVDFSSSVRSANGPLRWHRIPTAQLGPAGELRASGEHAGWNYALTAFTTGDRSARVSVDSPGPWIVYVNRREVLRSDSPDARSAVEVDLEQGANQVLVGYWHADEDTVSCAVRLQSSDGTPLAGADDTLELQLEGYAYVQGDGVAPAPPDQSFERETLRLIPLSYTNPAARSVSVVGSFNGWSPDANPMTQDESGKWVAGIRVPPGQFEYKFAVDGQLWIADPANPHRTADGFGGENSLLVVE